MKKRILTGWTFQRALFLLMGTLVIIQSIIGNQWAGVAFGGYFASMGLFSFGCASGACYNANNSIDPESVKIREIKNVEFEEIKQK